MAERYQIEVRLEGDDRLSTSLRNANNELNEFDNNQQRATSNSRGFVSGINNAHDAVQAFMGAAVIQGAARFAQQLHADGEAARRATITYREMAGGIDEATASLAELREQTGNAVSDVALMQGSNQLLVTGLADSTDQASDFVDMAIRLSTAMGVDAADGIENFNSALLNMSYARLDTLGIASSRVRERVAELVEVGYETEEAFQMAVLEEGANTLDRLGDAASLNETAFSRLTTQAEDYRNELGLMLNQAVETGAQLLILADIGLGGNGLGSIDEDAQQIRDRSFELFQPGYLNPGVETRLVDTAIGFSNSNPDEFSDITNRMEATPLSRFPEAERNEIASRFGYDNASISELRLVEQLLFAVADATEEATLVTEDLNDSSGKLAEAEEEVATASSRANTSVNEAAHSMRNLTTEQDELIASAGNLFTSLDENLGLLDMFADANSFELGGVEVFDPNDLAAVQAYAEELQANYEEISALAEDTDFEIVSRDEVSMARELADEAANIADEAERGAEAFANLSLDQLLGKTDGGQLGEFQDLILGFIQDEDVAAEASDTFDRSNGRTTSLSDELEGPIAETLARVAETFGTDVADELSQAALEQLQNGQAAELDEQTIIDNVFDAIGYRLEGAGPQDTYTVQPGDGAYAISATTGYSVEDVYESFGGAGVIIHPGQILELGEGEQLVAISQVSDDVLNAEGSDLDKGMGDDSDGEGMAIAAEQATAIETSFTNISALDLDPVIDPILADSEMANLEVEALDASLLRLTEADYSLQVEMQILLNDMTGLQLSQSFAFQEGVRMVMESNGLRLEDIGE